MPVCFWNMDAAMKWCRLFRMVPVCGKAFSYGSFPTVNSALLRTVSVKVNDGCVETVQRGFRKSVLLPSSSLLSRSLLLGTRHYSKSKDKKKSDKSKKKTVEINEEQLAEVINVDSLKTQMQKAVDSMKEDFVKNLSLRSTVGSIETLPVSFDGNDFVLQELAQVIRKNPKTVIINMSAFPQAIPAVLDSISKSGMNLNPQQDSTTIFIPVPKVTKEHRENLAKNAKILFVKYKDSIRDIQNKFLRQVKKSTSISEDFSHEAQDQIISIGHQYVLQMEKAFEAKQNELLGK